MTGARLQHLRILYEISLSQAQVCPTNTQFLRSDHGSKRKSAQRQMIPSHSKVSHGYINTGVRAYLLARGCSTCKDAAHPRKHRPQHPTCRPRTSCSVTASSTVVAISFIFDGGRQRRRSLTASTVGASTGMVAGRWLRAGPSCSNPKATGSASTSIEVNWNSRETVRMYKVVVQQCRC